MHLNLLVRKKKRVASDLRWHVGACQSGRAKQRAAAEGLFVAGLGWESPPSSGPTTHQPELLLLEPGPHRRFCLPLLTWHHLSAALLLNGLLRSSGLNSTRE
jgi:hypothetical protein